MKNGGSMESKLMGWYDHKFLTELVMVGSHSKGI